MDEEIIIDRGQPNIMKLDADEQALMDEIEISIPRPQPVPRPAPHRPQRPMHQEQDTMDAFVNPNKQTAPRQPIQEEEIDYGEELYDDDADEPRMGVVDRVSRKINLLRGTPLSMKRSLTLSTSWRALRRRDSQ
jgi:hypothetical protein